MKPSTAGFIAYDLRPAKQAERRILLDFLKCAGEAGSAISDCRYVGMGGTKFYDFHLLHRFLGISEMISLERDPDLYPRADFNCPFDFIDVKNETVVEFLAVDHKTKPTIYWLDYDDGISPAIVADVISLGTKLVLGGFAFITVCAHPPGGLANQNTTQRLEYFEENFGDFSTGLTLVDMEYAEFPSTVHRILVSAFKKAFSARTDGEFLPLFQIQYRDTTTMITVGGYLCGKKQSPSVRKRLRVSLPFLLLNNPYKIRSLALTEGERVLFDLAVTKSRSNSKQANRLRRLGFEPEDFKAYKDLIRFLPRYHESII